MPVRVYEILFDVDHYQFLAVADPQGDKSAYSIEVESFTGEARTVDRQTFDFGWGKPMPEGWQPFPLYHQNTDRPAPDVWAIENSVMGVTSAHYPIVEGHFLMSGQVLDIPSEMIEGNASLRLLNPLVVVNCLHHDACRWHEDDHGEYEKLDTSENKRIIFEPERLDAFPIFKIPEAMSMLLCAEEYGDPEEEFKAAVEQNGLTGLIFNLLWEES